MEDGRRWRLVYVNDGLQARLGFNSYRRRRLVLKPRRPQLGAGVHDSRGRYGRRATLRDAGGIDGENESFFPDDQFVSELRGCN
jgi:hypothetical protein